MPARPQTLALYLSTDSCSDLSTCWGLYYFHVAPALVGTSAYDKPTLCLFSYPFISHIPAYPRGIYSPDTSFSRVQVNCYIFKSGINTEVNITNWRRNPTPLGDPYAYNHNNLQDWFPYPIFVSKLITQLTL